MRSSTGQLEPLSNPFIRFQNEVSHGGRPIRTIRSVGFLAIVLLFIPSSLSAQAWLFPKGEGTVAISYQNVHVREHAFSKGEATDRGHSLSHILNVDVDYSVTRRLAVRIGMPYITARYHGSSPHPTVNDDGTYHGTFQDYSVDLRYNVSNGPVVLTPFFNAVIPSHGYEYFAHSAVGKNVHEYHVGTNVGRRLDPVLPEAYIQARYSYAFVSRVLGIAPNRSDTELQVGYFLTRRVSVVGTAQWTHTHDGVDFHCEFFHCGLPDDLWPRHDQIGKASSVDAGGGTVLAATRSMEVFASFARSVSGRNTHLHAAVVTIGISHTFGSGLREKGASSWAGAAA